MFALNSIRYSTMNHFAKNSPTRAFRLMECNDSMMLSMSMIMR